MVAYFIQRDSYSRNNMCEGWWTQNFDLYICHYGHFCPFRAFKHCSSLPVGGSWEGCCRGSTPFPPSPSRACAPLQNICLKAAMMPKLKWKSFGIFTIYARLQVGHRLCLFQPIKFFSVKYRIYKYNLCWKSAISVNFRKVTSHCKCVK